jgi:hypothetical protein
VLDLEAVELGLGRGGADADAEKAAEADDLDEVDGLELGFLTLTPGGSTLFLGLGLGLIGAVDEEAAAVEDDVEGARREGGGEGDLRWAL